MCAPITVTTQNSTNVRRTVGLTLAIWGAAVLEGWHDGVFARLSEGEVAALALFAFAFASASYFLDRNLRDMEISQGALAAALAAAGVALAVSAAFAREVAWLFAGPVAVALLAAAIDRALRGGVASRRLDLGNRLRSDLSRSGP